MFLKHCGPFFMTKIFSFTITILFLLIGLTLGILNPNLVPFDLFWTQIEMPLSLLLAIALVIGMLLASFYFFSQTLKLKWRLKRHEKANKKQLDEIIQLKKQMLELQTQKNDSDKKLLSLETTEH